MNRETIEARLNVLRQNLILVEAQASKADESNTEGRLKFNASLYQNIEDVQEAIKALEQELNK